MNAAAVAVKEVVGSLLRKQSAHVANILAISFDKSTSDAPFLDNDRAIEAACRSSFVGPLGAYHDIVAATLKAKRLVHEDKFVLAYDEHISGFIKFLEVFREESNWLVPWLHVFVYDARMLALYADVEAGKKRGDGEVHDNVKNAEQHLKRAFSMTVNDRAAPDLSKRPGTLYIVNQLFKIYFHVYLIRDKKNQLKLVDFQAAVDAVDSADLDMDALESLVANLIFMGYVKGYISHKLKILVLSKSNPFPAITDVLQDQSA
ncbi:hypothetical protein DYB34_002799 [Aphanomyces astaci]|uniref:PCI domain-containing protein n=1 Tax=Aphanomyces astaci TaxID=112090 RepID=A0A397FL40_APHAT|nr:hypothetical protein DYB34_002799 [Aphanomyces astaci]RHZ27286.1 hypothetical protein DYB31_011794 [Aphanomyces astaci]